MSEHLENPPVEPVYSRKELQAFLKAWKVRATGTTETLRQRYEEESTLRRRAEPSPTEHPVEISATTAAAAATNAHAIITASRNDNDHDSHNNSNMDNRNNSDRPSISETRLRRFRPSCPIPIQQRIQRALSQRLYLIERGEVTDPDTDRASCSFAVLGSTGNVYNVQIGRTATCNCPDSIRTRGLCKHILFVLLRVIALPADSPLIYQSAWLTSEVQHMFALLAARRVGGSSSSSTIVANDQVRNAYAKLQQSGCVSGGEKTDENDDTGDDSTLKPRRKSLEEDSDCPICFESLTMEGCTETLTYCRAMCGTNFHLSCIKRWSESAKQGWKKSPTTCPNCRQPWIDETTRNVPVGKEGYTNLGRLQGQSPIRDTSTYSSSPYKRRRME